MEALSLLDLQYFLPEIILLIFALTILLVGQKGRSGDSHFYLALAGLSIALIFAITQYGSDFRLAWGTIEVNNFSCFLKIIFLSLGIITVLGSKNFTNSICLAKEYFSFILLAIIGLLVVGMAGDLITLFIAFELTSISTYALPLIDKENKSGKEAALKYFITGAFSSGLILFGLSLLYGLTGTVIMKEIACILTDVGPEPIILVALAFLLAGFGYKMALVPFHLWAPDVYEGAPTAVTSFLAGVTKKGAFIVGLKIFLGSLLVIKLQTSIVLGLIAVLTMTIGNIVALMQKNTKRMLAYSSVAHAGNILVGLAIITELSVAGSILHIISHALMTLGIFFGILFVAGIKGDYDLDSFQGLRQIAPWTAFALFLILLSLAGIPPFLGFWSKMIIVIAAFEQGSWYMYLALALVLNSALSLVYYARMIKFMYMKDNSPRVNTKVYTAATPAKNKLNLSSFNLALYICVALITLTGFFPEQLVTLSREAARIIVP